MNAFADAIDAIFEDPNMALDALYRGAGAGAGMPVRVIRRMPDQVEDFAGSRFVTSGRMLDVRVSEVPELRPGDTFEIAGEVRVVMGEPVRDGEALIWQAEVRPL